MPVVRPGSVTVVAVLTYIDGVLNIIGGTIVLFSRQSLARVAGLDLAGVVTSAIISIILGIVILAVAHGLFSGSRVSRALVTVVMVVNLLNGLLLLFTMQFLTGILEVLWAVIVLSLLYTARANAFFGVAR